MDTINHYTLETGHNVISPRSKVADSVVEALIFGGFCSAGTHDMGVFGAELQEWRVRVAEVSHSWRFDIIHKNRAVAECLLSAQHDFEALKKFSASAVATPNPPYLLVRLGAGSIPSMEDSLWLGDFERCLAWALIEHRKVSESGNGG